MNDSNNDLSDLIESAHQDAQAQQDRAKERLNHAASQPRGKQIFTAVLMTVFAVVLFTQYPRFSEPYTWPDPATSSSAAEGELITVVGLIEAYRISQGQYPAVLSQVAFPEGLTALMAESVLVYRPAEQSYTLDWTLPHWTASYDSQTAKVSVVAAGKH
jgi:thiamine kinase-like enzyme